MICFVFPLAGTGELEGLEVALPSPGQLGSDKSQQVRFWLDTPSQGQPSDGDRALWPISK